MNWTVEYSKQAKTTLERLDRTVRNRIKNYVDKLKNFPNPRIRGEPLKGNLAEFWKYRIGDYRLVCKIEDEKLIILVVILGHRRDAYKI